MGGWAGSRLISWHRNPTGQNTDLAFASCARGCMNDNGRQSARGRQKNELGPAVRSRRDSECNAGSAMSPHYLPDRGADIRL
jgi:hypothetical protein